VIYSCFDPTAGLYDYYENGDGYPINGDLPVPKLPAPAGKIGVPAAQAGRPLPRDARHVGRGYTARGMIVECGRSGALSGEPAASTWPPAWKWAVALGLVGLTVWVSTSKPVMKFVQGGT